MNCTALLSRVPAFRRSHFRFNAAASVALLAGLILGALTPAARASFHLMQIEQVIGSVDGDATAQAIQLRMRSSGQNFLHSDAGGSFGPAGLIVYDATGANPVTLITFPNDVANGASGSRVLIASPNFASHTLTPLAADFTMTALIPAGYLAAGRLDYIDGKGNVLWSLSFGGAGYHGPLAAATFNGSFGAPFGGPLPGAGTAALQFQGVASASSASNAADYKLTTTGAAFINNAGGSFQLPADSAAEVVATIAAVRPEVSETGTQKGVLLVSRTGDASAPLVVHYKVGGSAVGGVQYQELPGDVTIPAGKASAKIKVAPLHDGAKTGDSIVKVTLLPGDGYSVGLPAKAKVKIIDAD